MIAFLRGTVFACSDEAVLLDVHGIGFQILMAAPALRQLKAGEEVLIHTYLAHKEDAMLLYGLLDPADRAKKTIKQHCIRSEEQMSGRQPSGLNSYAVFGMKKQKHFLAIIS